jgi:hypothetical protein
MCIAYPERQTGCRFFVRVEKDVFKAPNSTMPFRGMNEA